MAKEKEPKEAKPEAKSEGKSKSDGGSNKLFIIMFAGVMVIQLVIVFVVVFLFLNKPSTSSDKPSEEDKKKTETTKKEEKTETKTEEVEEGPVFGFQTKDIIVNPRGSGGKRFLMTQVGVHVSDEKSKKELEERESQINDIVNQCLSSKTADELGDIDRRDSLKIELKELFNKAIPGDKIKKVLFGKFVIQ